MSETPPRQPSTAEINQAIFDALSADDEQTRIAADAVNEFTRCMMGLPPKPDKRADSPK